MNESNPPPLPAPARNSLGKRLGYKLLIIASCIVLLQIPLFLVESKREERAQRQIDVVREITGAWGEDQLVHGALLAVPVASEERQAEPTFLHIAPTQLEIEGKLDPQILRRGIYRAEVYDADLKIAGGFTVPNQASEWADRLSWSEARLVLVLGDAAGVSLVEPLRWQGEEIEMAGQSESETGVRGIGARVAISDVSERFDFSVTVSMKGSESLQFAPLGQESVVTLVSAATSPSFVGAVLPDSREVTAEGFTAHWSVGSLERALPRVWCSADVGKMLGRAGGEDPFGVVLLSGVTDYRAVERALKYGILFLITVFAGCFLGEFLGGRPLHVLNYLLVGAALCLFFLALLALAELVGFGAAYALAALASVGLIVTYARAVMREGKAVGALAMVLGGIFGYLFLVLRMEDLSLIAGTVLLFVLLGAIMYATRHLRFEENQSLGGGAV